MTEWPQNGAAESKAGIILPKVKKKRHTEATMWAQKFLTPYASYLQAT